MIADEHEVRSSINSGELGQIEDKGLAEFGLEGEVD